MSLSPPPSREDLPIITKGGRTVAEMPRVWIKWFTDLRELVAPVGGLITWANINKTGSNLTDLTTRNHADLQNINTTNYTHLTALDATDLTDGGNTILHKHAHNLEDGLQGGTTDEYYHNTLHEDGLVDIIDTQWSTGILGAGGVITDGGSGTVNLAARSVLIRATDSDVADIAQYSVAAITGQALTDLVDSFIYVEYNAGVPQYAVSLTVRTDTNTNILVGKVYRSGTAVHIFNESVVRANDNIRRLSRRFVETIPFQRAEGAILSETGTRNISVTAGIWWECSNRFTTTALNTAVSGTFTNIYSDGAGGWTEQSAQTQIDNTYYDDGSGTLAALTTNRYAVRWIYIESDSDIIVVYGTGNHVLEASANAEAEPVRPHRIEATGRLIGKIVIRQGAATFTSIANTFDQSFEFVAPNNHNALSSLQGGQAGEYFHLTDAQNTDLTDGGLTTLHQHDFHSILFPADDKIGTPSAVSTLQDVHDYAMSAGVISGCEITDNGDGTVAVAAGEAFLRSSASEIATLMLVDVPADNSVSLTDNDANYIYADYSAGTPVVAVTTDVAGFNCLDKCVIAVVGREGTHLHIIEMAHQNVDSNRKHRRKLLETIPFAHIQGGCMLGGVGRKISLTAGGFWFGLERVTHAAFDTAGTDTISTYYRATPSGWTKTTGVTDFPNTQYDDASGTLATLGNNKFGVHWIYVAMGSVPHLALVYGQAEYASAAAASAATEPESLPPVFESTTLLVGRIIFEKSATSATAVDSAFRTIFGNSAITVHNNLSSLQGGTLNEYYHLTAAQNTVASTVLGASTTAAFDYLSPTTTQGDIIYHNGTDNVRLAKGTAAQVLTMNAGATAPEWAASGASDAAKIQSGTLTATTSGTSIDFTGIPAGVKRITVMFLGVSTNGTSNLILQIGDAGGIEATGYLSTAGRVYDAAAAVAVAFTTGFGVTAVVADASVNGGAVTLSLVDAATFAWAESGTLRVSSGVAVSGGTKSLSAELTTVRLTTVNGTDAFDAGSVNIQWEL